ncbi:TIGR03545 family protein [Pseudidiomarina maritima]|uniref:TIGR03545 family protein n=1 Tax=Pseudidiomarina maritima TaxID=519453 RepID=A0A1I6HW71_9GAMM|nr:TIGR03545 family protein [Pseudidiomarina maritima]SFR58648.1 TIGR03545 family protein [Pseudidiomarina maritima]
MSATNTKNTVRPSAIRWSGLSAFIIICALLVAFSWLLLDTIIKWTLERTIGTLNGAEVNISQVEHHWSPLGLKITGIQVTDPAEPEFNRLVIGDVTGEINVEQLLLGRFHFENVVSSGIRVHQQRSAPGEVYQIPDKQDIQDWTKDGLAKLNLSMPNVDDIIARVDLQTPAAIERAKATVAEQKAVLEDARDSLPTAEDLKAYEAELKKITEGEIKTPQQLQERREQFNALKEKFEADRARLKEVKEQASAAVDTLKADFEAVKSAPQQDLERAQQLMQLNSEGLSEITAVLFGEQMRQWSQYILLAYEQLAPMLARSADETLVKPQRGEGIWFEFSDANEPPSFLIKKAKTEFAWGETVLDVDWANITHQHEQLGQPTTFMARADNSSLWQNLNLNGELALTAEGIDAKQQWQVKGIQLNSLKLSEQAEFVATLAAALLDSEGEVSLRDNMFDGGGTVRLADMKVEASAQNRWTEVIANALRQLNRLDINADIQGALNAPEFSFNSDLDRQLGSALKAAALDAGRTELAGLQSKLQEQTGGFLGENQDVLASFSTLLGDADQRDAKLQELLKAKFESKLEDKLKDRLKGVLGG